MEFRLLGMCTKCLYPQNHLAGSILKQFLGLEIWLNTYEHLAALPKGSGSIPNSHMAAHNGVTPVPEDLVCSFDFSGHQAHTWCTDIYGGKKKTLAYIK